MNPFVILALAALALVGACADDGDAFATARADAEARPTAVRTAQPGPGTEWVHAVAAAKVSGSLYRLGSFFAHAPAAAAVALP